MAKFKIGDRVRRINSQNFEDMKIGDTGEVIHVDAGGDCMVRADKSAANRFNFARNLELVQAKWEPKVGDHVRIVSAELSHKRIHIGEEFTIERETYKVGDNKTWAGKGGGGFYVWRADELELVATAAAELQVEAGKFYKTRDGRKVGPIVRGTSGDRFWKSDDLGLPGYGAFWCKSGAFYPGSEFKFDLVAEWVDEPNASNDNSAPTKFKIGDIVKFRDDYGSSSNRGKKATVVNVSTWGIQVDVGGSRGVSTERPSSLELLSTAANPTAIVALIEDGSPKPATRPKVHTDQDSAVKEAERLALLYPGQEFGVFVLTNSKIADAVTETVTRAVLRAA